VSLAVKPKDPNVGLTLELVPPTTLPGIPVTVRIRVSNGSAQRVELPYHVILFVTNEAGETFPVGGPVAVGMLGKTDVGPRSSTLLEVEARGAALQEFSWFDDPRLNMPGRYRLQIVMGTFSAEGPAVPASALRTNTATLDVVMPVGVDLAVWKEMLRAGAGKWAPSVLIHTAGSELARRVITETPRSAYAGWFAASGPWQPARVSAALLRDWLEQAPPDEFTEWREYRLALLEEGSTRQWSDIPPDQARTHVRRALTLLTKLKQSKNPNVARAAAERLEFDADLEESIERLLRERETLRQKSELP